MFLRTFAQIVHVLLLELDRPVLLVFVFVLGVTAKLTSIVAIAALATNDFISFIGMLPSDLDHGALPLHDNHCETTDDRPLNASHVRMKFSHRATLSRIVPSTLNEPSAHERMILDLEKTAHSAAARDSLCRLIRSTD